MVLLELSWRKWLARSPGNQKVGGSNPSRSDTFQGYLVKELPSVAKATCTDKTTNQQLGFFDRNLFNVHRLGKGK